MSTDAGVVERIVAAAIAELNLQRSADEQLGDAPGAPLFGDGGPLDSLGLVQLIAELEHGLEQACGVRINLADETLLEAEDMPFRSVGALQAYLKNLP